MCWQRYLNIVKVEVKNDMAYFTALFYHIPLDDFMTIDLRYCLYFTVDRNRIQRHPNSTNDIQLKLTCIEQYHNRTLENCKHLFSNNRIGRKKG